MCLLCGYGCEAHLALTCAVVMVSVPGDGSTGADAGQGCQEAMESMELAAIGAIGPVSVNKRAICKENDKGEDTSGNCINREGKMIACAHPVCLRNTVKGVTVLAFLSSIFLAMVSLTVQQLFVLLILRRKYNPASVYWKAGAFKFEIYISANYPDLQDLPPLWGANLSICASQCNTTNRKRLADKFGVNLEVII